MQAFSVPLFLADSCSACYRLDTPKEGGTKKHVEVIDASIMLPRNRRDSADFVEFRLLRDSGSVVRKETLQHVFR